MIFFFVLNIALKRLIFHKTTMIVCSFTTQLKINPGCLSTRPNKPAVAENEASLRTTFKIPVGMLSEHWIGPYGLFRRKPVVGPVTERFVRTDAGIEKNNSG